MRRASAVLALALLVGCAGAAPPAEPPVAGYLFRFDSPVSGFDGKGPSVRPALPPSTARELTLFVVAAPDSNEGGYRGLVSANAPGKNDYTSGFNLDLGGAGGDGLDFVNAEGAGFSGERNLMKGRFELGTFHVLALEIAASAVQLHVDGARAGRRERKDAVMDLSQVRVGARHYSNTKDPTSDQGFFHGAIAEVILYARRLTDEERKSVETYLAKRHEALLRRPPPPRPEPVAIIVPGFTVRKLPIEITNINNLEYAPDGRLIALGYDGRLHALVDADGDGLEETVKPYWYRNEGDFRGPIGMVVANEGVYVASKGKVSLVRDADGDGAGDSVETVATGWKEIPQAVDTVGLALDREGNLFFGLGCENFANAYLLDKEGKARYDIKSERGTIQKLSPDRKRRETVCTGVRFPVSMAFNRHGDLFATDQEGATWLPDGNPLDELLHILPGRHYGFPQRHPQHNPTAVDEPAVVLFGPQHQSTCGFRFNEGRAVFGPAAWEGDALVTGESRGKIWRVPLVKTRAGYVGKPVLIASLRMLTIDLCVSPKGDLVVACHSGKPDWGTGPKGPGSIFKISYTDRAAPQPVAAWPAGPLEVRVAFDRRIDSEALAPVSIEYGEFVSAADRLESMTPPYKVCEEQKRAPRRELKVAGRKLSADGRTLILSTAPHPWRATYALTLGSHHLAYDFSGVEASWNAEGKEDPEWTGWLPHFDPEVAKRLTAGSAEHERLWALMERRGGFEFGSRLVLPEGGVRLRFASDSEAFISCPGGEAMTRSGEFRFGVTPDNDDLRMAWAGVKAPLVSVRAPETSHERALSIQNLLLPWAPATRPPPPDAETKRSPFASGDAKRGRELFFGEAKCGNCHQFRGEGGAFAPDLTNSVHRDPATILKDIVEPSAMINPDYVGHTVQLRDGRVLSGVVLPEGTDQLRIVNPESEQMLIRRDQVVRIRPNALSNMPDGFGSLGEEKLRDLVTFLTTPPPAR